MKLNSATNLTIIVSLLTLVSSCSGSVKGNWSCPTPEGGKGSCVSIKDADMNDSPLKDKPNFNYVDSAQKIEIKLVTPKFKDLKKLQQEKDQKDGEGSSQIKLQTGSVGSQVQETRLRTPEKVGKIWFAPHIDSDGNQHSESITYVVDEEPKWVSLGVKHD
jgi:type IV conjugative transfer system lipoprotein TraV